MPFLVRTITPPGFGTAFEDGRAGDRLPGSPQNQFSIFADYTVPLANGNDVILNGGYAWQGDVLTRTGARGSSVTLDPFGVANVSATFCACPWSENRFIAMATIG